MSSASPSLRDTVQAALSSIPNAYTLGVTVLTSAPKRTASIFPHTPSSNGRCWETEYLVVVHSSLPPQASTQANENSTEPESEPHTQAASNSTSLTSTTPKSVLASAISAHLYTLPASSNSLPTSLLYISKVDSSGYAPPGHITREVAIAVLSHFLSPATRPTARVTATLFARSQGQYLFPNSIEGGGKRVLGGLGLCGWWKGVYEETARRLVAAGSSTVSPTDLSMRYLLPSYTAPEAAGMVGAPRRPLPSGVKWEYAPPFVVSHLPPNRDEKVSIATLIPCLPDDPKTRFMDELVDDAFDAGLYDYSTSNSKSKDKDSGATDGTRKRSRRERVAEADEDTRRRAHNLLAKVPPEEFWERLGFRQECSSGDVTGFFSMTVTGENEKPSEGQTATRTVSTQQAGAEVRDDSNGSGSSNGNGATTVATPTPAQDKSENTSTYLPPPPSSANTLPQALVERVLTSMLNTDFGTRAMAADGTAHWLASVKSIVTDEIGERGWQSCTATIQPSTDGAVPVGVVKRKEETVTMLMPRKKKR